MAPPAVAAADSRPTAGTPNGCGNFSHRFNHVSTLVDQRACWRQGGRQIIP